MTPLLIDREGVCIHVYAREHVPPHIHASSGEDEALITIRTGEIIAGYLSPKKLRVVQKWLSEGETRKLVEENFYELNPRLRVLAESRQENANARKSDSKKGEKSNE